MAQRQVIPQQTLGIRLYMARRQARLDRQEIAEQVGASDKSVGKWENDACEPRSRYLVKWAEATGVPVGWLLTGEPTFSQKWKAAGSGLGRAA